MTDYQMFPPHTEQVYQALKEDIAKRGIQIPIEVDEDDNILDGNQRKRALDELGIDWHKHAITRFNLTEDQKREQALKLNLLRRQLSDDAWAAGFLKLAEVKGVRVGSGGDHRSNAHDERLKAGDLARELGVSPATARRRLARARGDQPKPKTATNSKPKGRKSPSEPKTTVRRYARSDDSSMNRIQNVMLLDPQYLSRAMVNINKEYALELAKLIMEVIQ